MLYLQVSIRCIMRHSKPPAKLRMAMVLPLLLLCYGVGNVHCSIVHENSEDFRSLIDFKGGITDPNGALNNWTNSTHFCRWNGVHCSSTPPYRVTELYLSGHNLGGQVSSSLGNLTFLDKIDLSNNSFHGPIPSLNKLQHLTTLHLESNQFQGFIPDTLLNCTNLFDLDLSRNNLTGVIPPRIGSLTNLASITLDTNHLTGGIPAALGNITTLQVVSFTQNRLNGRIPHEVMKMPNLAGLYLDQNDLSGEIPAVWQMPNILQLYLGINNLSGRIPQTLSNVSSLEELSLTSNMLGNSLPSNIGEVLPNLTILFLADNNFDGHIPASLGNPKRLEKLDLSGNQFTGQIPSSLGKLTQLQVLNLERNMLQSSTDNEGWEFLQALGNCSSLSVLSLSNNKLQGAIPNSIANLSPNLTNLIMGGNSLSGIVPPSIGKFSALIKLSLDNNNLTGKIEEWIGNLTKLQHLNLQSNRFNGTIPPSIGHLTQLANFSLAQNHFTGIVPSSLGNLKSLSELHLSYNSFQGSIPVELGKIITLTILNLSSNTFSGGIPDALSKLENINTVQLDQNNLTGNIPCTFSNLYTLSTLNLSHNNLSGPMPDCLNVLKSLTKLDISYNNLQGDVPTNGIFANATIISLYNNPGLCGGATDLHLPSCHVNNKKVGMVNYLIKILIPIFGFMSLVLLGYFLLLERKKSRRAYMSLELGEHFEKVTYTDLALATRDFSKSNLIGRGSYGSVYRGKLKESKKEVAVKVFDLGMRGAERSFIAECEALRSIQHRNLLPIITACSTVDNIGNVFKALIYELMPNGSLDTWLHHKGDEEAPKRLSLTQRIGIAVNIADALDYLHHDCGRPTVHRDLKPSNILLDCDMNALLGDFGIALLYVDPHQSALAGSISSIGVKGTIGYIPPEYGSGGHASTSGDVYSFGIVLLEILTGKRPTDAMFMDGLDIINFVENSFPDQIIHVIDAHLMEECKNLTEEKSVTENDINQCLLDLLQVALSCTRSLPSERLNMKQVASQMHGIKASQFRWKCKK